MVRFSFLLMLSILTLVSCGDDDDNMSNSEIVGTWELQSSTTGNNIVSGGSDFTTTLVYLSGDVELEFKGDGTYDQRGTGSYNSVSLIDTDTFFVQPQTLDLTQTGTYTTVNGVVEFVVTGGTNQNEGLVTTFSVVNDQLFFELSGNMEVEANGRLVDAEFFGDVVYDKL